MATRDTPFAPGTPCWVDLMTSDLQASKTFYGTLFGWEFADSGDEFGNYNMATKDGHNVAGMMANPPENPGPDGWTTYIATADVDATLRTAGEGGANTVMEAMDVGDVGRMAMVVDPSGAAVGLWQAGAHTGFGVYNEPGAVTWDELHSKDFAAATDFYAKVFGWDYDHAIESAEMVYWTAKVDGETVAGLGDGSKYLPDGVPSHWTLYFAVEDCDDAVAQAVGLGATVNRAAEDTPFGRMADLVDPGGVAFKLHSEKLANPPVE